MQLHLYNNRIRKKQLFTPLNPSCVTVYVCGPTVYGRAHIGNARAAVVFDVLVRLLRALYPQVTYVRNVTDIDDKINAKADAEGVDISVISRRFHKIYMEDMAQLCVLPPDKEPHATDYIAPMLAMIEKLVASQHAYVAEGHVLFDVTRDDAYGSLSGRSVEDMIAGARVEVAPFKRNAADFVLWKPSTPEQPGWDSPYGRGRPGWHIECSAMIKQEVGDTVDIHGGGVDLQFPHHENECAQSRCAHGAELANFWLHNGMLTLSGEKMSKSLGNIRLINALMEDYPPEAIRLTLLQGHYRQPIDFTPALLEQSTRTLEGLYRQLDKAAAIDADKTAAIPQAFLAGLCDDINTPKALAVLFALAKKIDTPETKGAFLHAANILGLLQKDPAIWRGEKQVDIDHARVEELIAARAQARADKDYAAADAARDKLTAMGVHIEDTPAGTKWHMGG